MIMMALAGSPLRNRQYYFNPSISEGIGETNIRKTRARYVYAVACNTTI
jgi:hypothetical protein